MNPLSLADRLINVMSIVRDAQAAAKKINSSAGESPRSEIEMAISEQVYGLEQAFIIAYSNIDRLRLVARALEKHGAIDDR